MTIKAYKDRLPIPKFEIVRDAYLLAEQYHRHQMYADDKPYTVHLLDTVNVLIEFGHVDPIEIATAWTHDIIEDTSANYDTVLDALGTEVAELVFALTDELGRSRKDRKKLTMLKLFKKVESNGAKALKVKLADWIANVRQCHRSYGQKLEMYQKEWGEFESTFRNMNDDGSLEPMWEELERLIKGEG